MYGYVSAVVEDDGGGGGGDDSDVKICRVFSVSKC